MGTVADLKRELEEAIRATRVAISEKEENIVKIESEYEAPSSINLTKKQINSIITSNSDNSRRKLIRISDGRYGIAEGKIYFPDAMARNSQYESSAEKIVESSIADLMGYISGRITRIKKILGSDKEKEGTRDALVDYEQIYAELERAASKIASSDRLVDASERSHRINGALEVLNSIPDKIKARRTESTLLELQYAIKEQRSSLNEKLEETKSQVQNIVFLQLQNIGVESDDPIQSLGFSLDILRAAAKMYEEGEHADEEKLSETNSIIEKIVLLFSSMEAAQAKGVTQEELLVSLDNINSSILGIDITKMNEIIQDNRKKQYSAGLEKCKEKITELKESLEQKIEEKELRVLGHDNITEYYSEDESLLSRVLKCEEEINGSKEEDSLVDIILMMRELKSIKSDKDKLESSTKDLILTTKIQKREKFIQDSISLFTEVLKEFGILAGSESPLKLTGAGEGHEFSLLANIALQEIIDLSTQRLEGDDLSLEMQDEFSNTIARNIHKIMRSQLLALNTKMQEESSRREQEYGKFISLLDGLNIQMPQGDRHSEPENIRAQIGNATNLPKVNRLLAQIKEQAGLVRASYAEQGDENSLYSLYKTILPEVKKSLASKVEALKYQDLGKTKDIPEEYRDYKAGISALEREISTLELEDIRGSIFQLYEMNQKLALLQEEKEEIVSTIILQQENILRQEKEEIENEIQPNIDALRKLMKLEFPESFTKDRGRVARLAERLISELSSIKSDANRLTARVDFNEDLVAIKSRIAPLKEQAEDFINRYMVAHKYAHEYSGFSMELQEYSAAGVADEIQPLAKASLTEEVTVRTPRFVKVEEKLLDVSNQLKQVQIEREKLRSSNRLDEIWEGRVADDVRYSSTEKLTEYPTFFRASLEKYDSVVADASDWYLSRKRGVLEANIPNIERSIFLLSYIDNDIYKTVELNFGARKPKDFSPYQLEFHRQFLVFDKLHVEIENRRHIIKELQETIIELDSKIKFLKDDGAEKSIISAEIMEVQRQILSKNISRFESIDLDTSFSDFVSINEQLRLSINIAKRVSEELSDHDHVRVHSKEDLGEFKIASERLLDIEALEQELISLQSKLSTHEHDYDHDASSFEARFYYKGQEAIGELLKEVRSHGANLSSYDYISRLENLKTFVKQYEDHSVDMASASDLINPSYRAYSLGSLLNEHAASSFENKREGSLDGDKFQLSLREYGNKAMGLLYSQYKSPALHEYAKRWCSRIEITKRYVDEYNDDIKESLSNLAKLSREFDKDVMLKSEILDPEIIALKERMQRCLQSYEKMFREERNEEKDCELLEQQKQVLHDYEEFQHRLKEIAEEKINDSIDMLLQIDSLTLVEKGRDTLSLIHGAMKIIKSEEITGDIFRSRIEEISSSPKAKYLRKGAMIFARGEDGVDAISDKVSMDLRNFKEKAREIIRIKESIKTIDKLEGLSSALIEDCIDDIVSYKNKEDGRLQEALIKEGQNIESYDELLSSFESEISEKKEQFKEAIKREAIEAKDFIIAFEATQTSKDKQRLLDTLSSKLKNLDNLRYSEPPGTEESSIYYAELSLIDGNVREQYKTYEETIKSLKAQVLKALDNERKQEIKTLIKHNVTAFKGKLNTDNKITDEQIRELFIGADHDILIGLEGYEQEHGYQQYYIEEVVEELVIANVFTEGEDIRDIRTLHKVVGDIVTKHNNRKRLLDLFTQLNEHIDSVPEITIGTPEQIQESIDASREHLQRSKEIFSKIQEFGDYEDIYQEKYKESFLDVYGEYEKGISKQITAASDTLLVLKIHSSITKLNSDMQQLSEMYLGDEDIDGILRTKRELYIENIDEIIQCYTQVSSAEVKEEIAKLTRDIPIDGKCAGLLEFLKQEERLEAYGVVDEYILDIKKNALLQKFKKELSGVLVTSVGQVFARLISLGDAGLRQNIFESYKELFMEHSKDPILRDTLNIIGDYDFERRLSHIRSIYEDLLAQGEYAEIKDILSSQSYIKDTLTMLEMAYKEHQLRCEEYDRHDQYSLISRKDYTESKVCTKLIGFRLLSKLSSGSLEEQDEFLEDNIIYIKAAADNYIDEIIDTISRHEKYLNELRFPKDVLLIEEIINQIKNEKENLSRFERLQKLIPDEVGALEYKLSQAKIALYDVEDKLQGMKISLSEIKELNKCYVDGPYEVAYKKMCEFLKKHGLNKQQSLEIPGIFHKIDELFTETAGAFVETEHKLSTLSEFARRVAFEASVVKRSHIGYSGNYESWYEVEPNVVKTGGFVEVEHSSSLLKYNQDHDDVRREPIISLLKRKSQISEFDIIKGIGVDGVKEEEISSFKPKYTTFLSEYFADPSIDEKMLQDWYLINEYAELFPQIQELLEQLINENRSEGDEYVINEMPIPIEIISELKKARISILDSIRDSYFLCVTSREFGTISADVLYDQVITVGEREYKKLPGYSEFIDRVIEREEDLNKYLKVTNYIYKLFDKRLEYSDAELKVMLSIDNFVKEKDEVEASARDKYTRIYKEVRVLELKGEAISDPRRDRAVKDLEDTLGLELNLESFHDLSTPEQDRNIEKLREQESSAKQELQGVNTKIERIAKDIKEYQSWIENVVRDHNTLSEPHSVARDGRITIVQGATDRKRKLKLYEDEFDEFERVQGDIEEPTTEDPKKLELLIALNKLKELYRRMGYSETEITDKIEEYKLQEQEVNKIFSKIEELNTRKSKILEKIRTLDSIGSKVVQERVKADRDAELICEILSKNPIEYDNIQELYRILTTIPLYNNLDDETSLSEYENVGVYQQEFNKKLVELGVRDKLDIEITNKADLLSLLIGKFPALGEQLSFADDEQASVSSILEASADSYVLEELDTTGEIDSLKESADISWIDTLLKDGRAFHDIQRIISQLNSGGKLFPSVDEIMPKLLQINGSEDVSIHEPQIIMLRQLVKSVIDDDREKFNQYKSAYEVCFVLDDEYIAEHDKVVDEIRQEYYRLYDEMKNTFGRSVADFTKMQEIAGIPRQCQIYKEMIAQMPDSYIKRYFNEKLRSLEIRVEERFELPILDLREDNLVELKGKWLRKLDSCSRRQRKSEQDAEMVVKRRQEWGAEEIDRLKESITRLKSIKQQQDDKLGEREQELLDVKRRLAAATMRLHATSVDDEVSKDKLKIAKELREQVRDYYIEEDELSTRSRAAYQHIIGECEQVVEDYHETFSLYLPGIDADGIETLRYASGAATRIVGYNNNSLEEMLSIIDSSSDVIDLEEVEDRMQEFLELVSEEPPNTPIAYDNVHNKLLLMTLQSSYAIKSIGGSLPSTLSDAASMAIKYVNEKIENIKRLEQEEKAHEAAMLEQIKQYNNERVKSLTLELIDIAERINDSLNVEELEQDHLAAKDVLDKILAFDPGNTAIDIILEYKNSSILKERIQPGNSVSDLSLAILDIYKSARNQYDIANMLSRELINLFAQIPGADTVRIANHIPHSISDILKGAPHTNK